MTDDSAKQSDRVPVKSENVDGTIQGSNDIEPDRQTPNSQPVKWFQENSIPITGLILLALVICFVGHYAWGRITLARTKDLSEALKNFFEVGAIIVGGWWAIFRFRIGREFQESLIPIVSGRLVMIENQPYLVVHTEIKNVGQSKIGFFPKASTLKIWKYRKPLSLPSGAVSVPDEIVARFDPLDDLDRYVEPNEIIQGTHFIVIRDMPELGFRLELIIISPNNNYTWRSACMVEKTSSSGNMDSVGSLLKGVQNEC